MHLILTRDTFTPKETLGTLEVAGQIFHTIERAWIPGDDPGEDGGEPGKSCVPLGTYALAPHSSAKYPRVFALVNPALDVVHYAAPGKRYAVLIHAANWARELRGCIAPGLSRAQDPNGWMVLRSRDAMARIRTLVSWTVGHTLEIRSKLTE